LARSDSVVLAVHKLCAGYGKARVLHDISLDVGGCEVVALLGANGAGKTTLLNTLCGFIKPSGGTISLEGEAIGGAPPHRIFRNGMVQVSQGRDLFREMSVLDNLELGATVHNKDLPADLARVLDYFPRLAERRHQMVGTLSGGEQQMVAIGRALMSSPRMLLLDEPSGGLAPRFVQEIGHIMQALKAAGKTMLLVEQNIGLAMSVADRFCVLRDGRIVYAGLSSELSTDYAALAHEYYL
jgi:branched-chain amino acid transport system ATP-binding protein